MAFGAALMAMENSYQVALMCPTESLALQHFLKLKEVFAPSSHSIDLLLGSTPLKQKKELFANLANGQIDLIVGTHSLIQDYVTFKNLSLVIIDEQHKFGVEQRLKLMKKNPHAHCLSMTATPIPRSLCLTQYGDLDISMIKTMPAHRKKIKTKIVEPSHFKHFLNFLCTRLQLGEQIYIVVPMIVGNEKQDLINLKLACEKFEKYFPHYRLKSLHGQLKASQKSQIFIDFRDHKIDILISTSVIEVGINIPNATVMAIMNPHRFGLSSLHQLRGRVGRGQKPGFCFLVNDKEINPASAQRLKIIEKICDGFKISEEDLKMRGEGDLLGPHQSGIMQSKILANPVIHQDLLLEARCDINDSP